ncbi:hypothetical protein FSOLCH5_007855 [Fusarium solani]
MTLLYIRRGTSATRPTARVGRRREASFPLVYLLGLASLLITFLVITTLTILVFARALLLVTVIVLPTAATSSAAAATCLRGRLSTSTALFSVIILAQIALPIRSAFAQLAPAAIITAHSSRWDTEYAARGITILAPVAIRIAVVAAVVIAISTTGTAIAAGVVTGLAVFAAAAERVAQGFALGSVAEVAAVVVIGDAISVAVYFYSTAAVAAGLSFVEVGTVCHRSWWLKVANVFLEFRG